jgi:hypothetical protein
MMAPSERMALWADQARATVVVAKKDELIFAPLSPLTCAADRLRGGLGELRFVPAWMDALALAPFAAGFLALARSLHHRRDRAL